MSFHVTTLQDSTASQKKLLQGSPSLATQYSMQYSEEAPPSHHQVFESPYATSNVIFDSHRVLQVTKFAGNSHLSQ